ncbi:MAG: hypothetical protein JKY52_20770 [Flavobacteriales bacterium]|nr:hypothetical protein [Flavobacteriales bacterium]
MPSTANPVQINVNRLIMGGVIGGIAMLAIEFFVHAMLLRDEYLVLTEWGTIRADHNLRGALLHHMAIIFSGIPLAFLYVLARDKVGAGPNTAAKVGVLAWLICLPGILALYAFYNAGSTVPLATAASTLATCIVGTLVAGSIYRD